MANIITPGQIPAKSIDRAVLAACAVYGLLLLAFWLVARHFAIEVRIQGHMASSFTSFALLLAPYWFFGFGAAGMFQRLLTNRGVRVLIPGLLLVPYLIFSVPRGEFRWVYAVVLFSIPVAMAALFEFLPPGGVRPAVGQLCWQDVVALAVVGLPVEFGWIGGSFPHPGLSTLPKILLVDSTLYAFLVVRRLEGVGYDFRARCAAGHVLLRCHPRRIVLPGSAPKSAREAYWLPWLAVHNRRDLRVLPFQQAAALQLALRVSGNHCRSLLRSRMARSQATAAFGNHPHPGGCHLVFVVSMNWIWGISMSVVQITQTHHHVVSDRIRH